MHVEGERIPTGYEIADKLKELEAKNLELEERILKLEERYKKEVANKKHSFAKSPYSDYVKFCEALKDWPEAKCKYWHGRAKDYSEANGAKYANWVMAVRNWDKMRPWKPVTTMPAYREI